MSLEGLDSAQLAEAFETAQAEPGGWFWIGYASRDEVELLTKGAKGSEEMRHAAMGEPDDSPLYGFIRFRRRSVLVKYIPEGTSRVLKARSQVHFQLVAERFSPHDATHQISSPYQLTDSGLNSSCSTHTATASISSSNSSLRQRRLADIAESADEGDDGGSTAKNSHHANSSAAHRPLDAAVDDGSPQRAGHGGERLAVVVTSYDGNVHSVYAERQGPAAQAHAPDRDAAPSFLLPTKGDHDNLPVQHSPEPRRKSTSSARPSLKDDIYNYYPYVPKVKLGPRPVGAADSLRRPHTANERSKTFSHSSAEELRAAIPKSVILPSRKPAQPPVRSTSLAATLELPQPPASPIAPSSPSSVVSLPFFPSSPSSSLHSPDPHAITPEKQRLMKALQLRRQNMITAEKKEQDTVDHSGTDATDSGSEEKTPTRATMFASQYNFNSGPDGLQRLEVPGGTNEVTDDEHGEEGQATPVEIKRPEVSIQIVGVTSEPGTSSIASPEEPKKEVGSPAVEESPQLDDGVMIEDVKEEQQTESVVEVIEQPLEKTLEKSIVEERQPTPAIEETLAPDETDKSESTKVRDDVDSESDAESARSMDVHLVLEDSPHITQSVKPATPTTVPIISKTMHHPSSIAMAVKPSLPIRSLKRADRTIERTSQIPNEPAIVETARSVSAPFLKTARSQSRGALPEPAVLKKVNVGGGSVSQRIKQFQQLATSAPPPVRPLTPSRSGANSPNPSMLNRSPSFNTTPPPALRRGSFNATAFECFPPATEQAPPPPKPERSMERIPPPRDEAPNVEIVEKDNRPQLQVTTKIHREKSRTPSPTSSSTTMKRSPKSSSPPPEKSLRRRSIDISSVVDMMTPRRSSVDGGSSSRRASMEKERPERSERPRLFSRASNRDLEQLPEDSVAKGTGSRRASTSSGNGSKSPSFLKRVSSTLSRKHKETASPDRSPSVSPLPSEPAQKTWLLTGWINVQLPDTMLWRRRCIKVDSNGWLFLSLSEDETAAQTRRYHIPTEVRKIDLPDVDEQELPHSVRLTLQEGGMLQCACQNSREQKEVLGVIRRCASSS